VTEATTERKRIRWGLWLGGVYLVLLAASHAMRLANPVDEGPSPDVPYLYLRAVDGERTLDQRVRMAYRRYVPEEPAEAEAPVILFLHGSPGNSRSVRRVSRYLSDNYRVLAPDLPGFGESNLRIPDYSILAHANYTLQFLDSLGVAEVHAVGFSLGGGVALELSRLAPERVRSLTLLSSIGVQELELLGDYTLNRAVHALQLAVISLAQEGVPHFGRLDRMGLNTAYARNFYDTDQRPLRGILEEYDKPVLIVHGDGDVLVPAAAAREHHRVVPQSQLEMIDGDHFMTFMRPEVVAAPIREFVAEVEAGEATTRATADPDRVREAARPFDPHSIPGAQGFSLLVVLFLLACATMASEDLTGIGAGLLVARGTLGFLPATLAVIAGIFSGDLAIYLAGRFLGRPALGHAPLKWLVKPATIERSRRWFERRGAAIIFLSRFTPGTRVVTYIAAGVLRMRFPLFVAWLFLAVAVWVPLLVGTSAIFGTEVTKIFEPLAGPTWPWILAFAILLFIAIRVGLRLLTHRGRRRLLGRWRRITRWEFWPPWIFYLPTLLYVLWLGIKHRSLTLFTAANPALPDGGVVGESKLEIHRGLAHAARWLPKTELLPIAQTLKERVETAREFMRREGLAFPVLFKPDVGERGDGVEVIRTEDELEDYLARAKRAILLQEYIAGDEYGVFYYRMPDQDRGQILAITEKRLQSVRGDGVRTLEQLILDDDQALCQARLFLHRQEERLDDVPAQGEETSLGELGNHCQGARFFDGTALVTPELAEVVDRISRGYDGFYVGRYDFRVPSLDDFQAGRNLKIIELNGVTSEATNIYDPKNSLGRAYGTLFEQWRIIFRIAEQNRRAGVRPTPLPRLLARIIRHYF
jgi:pimeloyl-ACP methyl ester carboxylesterase/membrane protein DedA with SNARE-associated domain